ncbi:PQQ-binding-like beta-propeller repeat protein [Armatimonas sp.]|uniref:PQQ-binding-like beta-propeller repeat protein n=1 Tax=Armatimonas sp. TaxID=1872638 RepID=UPI0037516156
MSNKIQKNALTRRRFVTLSGNALLVSVVTGCGGGHPKDAVSGRVRLTITWPDAADSDKAASRYIPAYALSLVFELYKQDTPSTRYTLLVNRPDSKPATQSVSFAELLPIGTYVLAGTARGLKDGFGSTVASALTTVEVRPDEIGSARLTLASTIRTIEILGQPLQLKPGESLTLTGRALDPDGKAVFLPGGALTWQLVSGSDFASLSADGLLSARAAGVVRVRLTETQAAVFGEANITIDSGVQPGGGVGLAHTTWPIAGGDGRNSARGSGSVAQGSVHWSIEVGGYTSPVVGTNGTVYIATLAGTQLALNPTSGATLWSHTVFPNNVVGGATLLGDDGTLYTSTTSGIFALNAATGQKIYQIDGTFSFNPMLIPINLGEDGILYVMDRNGKLLAYDTKTRKLLWSTVASTERNYGVMTPAAGTVQTYSSDGGDYPQVRKLDPRTGALVWERTIQGYRTLSGPLLTRDGNTVVGNYYYGNPPPPNRDQMHCISAAGEHLWFVQQRANFVAEGADGAILALDNGTGITAYDATTGQQRWRTPFVSSTDNRTSPGTLLVDGANTLFTGDRSGNLLALNASTGAIKWQYSFDALIGGGSLNQLGRFALGSGGRLYLLARGKLVAFE